MPDITVLTQHTQLPDVPLTDEELREWIKQQQQKELEDKKPKGLISKILGR